MKVEREYNYINIIKMVNIIEEELLKLRDNSGTKSNGYKLVMNRFRVGIKTFLNIRGVKFWNNLPAK